MLTFRRSGARRLGDRDRVSNSANDSTSSDRNSVTSDRDSFTRWRDRHCYGQQQHRQRQQQWLEGALQNSGWEKDPGLEIEKFVVLIILYSCFELYFL